MDGPAFSTRAESELNRRHGFDVIGMTNLPEAKLAREAEIALATMAMITDYDCWKIEEEPVSAQTVIEHLLANAETARKSSRHRHSRGFRQEPNWPEHRALDSALITDRKLWPAATREKLRAILTVRIAARDSSTRSDLRPRGSPPGFSARRSNRSCIIDLAS